MLKCKSSEMPLNFPNVGYTPFNYQFLVKTTGMSNADFYRKFDIHEQTFYSHYAGNRTMNWRKWQDLLDSVLIYMSEAT